MKRRDNKKVFFILVALLIVVILVSAVAVAYSLLTDTKEFDVMLEVSDHIGFVVDSGPLDFGSVMPAGTGQRELIIENKDDFSKFVHLEASGRIKDWISFSGNDFVINGNETVVIGVRARTQPTTPYGNYTSKVTLYLTRMI